MTAATAARGRLALPLRIGAECAQARIFRVIHVARFHSLPAGLRDRLFFP